MPSLLDYYYYYKAVVFLKICRWAAYFWDPDNFYQRGAKISAECGGKEHSSKTISKFEVMVQGGKGGNVIGRALPYYLRRWKVGSKAPDGIVHRYGSLEEVPLSSFFRPGRMTVLNFGSYT